MDFLKSTYRDAMGYDIKLCCHERLFENIDADNIWCDQCSNWGCCHSSACPVGMRRIANAAKHDEEKFNDFVQKYHLALEYGDELTAYGLYIEIKPLLTLRRKGAEVRAFKGLKPWEIKKAVTSFFGKNKMHRNNWFADFADLCNKGEKKNEN